MKRTNKQFATLIKAVLGAIALVIMALGANAQNASAGATQTTNLSLTDVIELSFVSGSGGTVSVGFANATQLANGVETAVQNLKVRSNKKFKIAVNSTSSNFTYSGTASLHNVIPVSTGLQVMVTANNTGGSLTVGALLGFLGITFGSSTTLITNCDPGSNQTFSVKYKATPGILAAPGTYTTDVVFTATQL